MLWSEIMLIGLHDAEREHLKISAKNRGKFPNFALMKISAWHKSQGDTVEWWNALKVYDRVYSSKIFDFTPENPYLPPDTIKGGTGYEITKKLPPEIDEMFPDYSIYPHCDYAIGFLTRGCPNKCRWCVVPQKEGNIAPYRDISEIARHDTDKIILMDNNILACDFGLEQLEKIAKMPYQIDLNQGIDARLVTPEIADILARINWIKYVRFSCDTIAQIGAVARAVELLKNRGIKPYKVFIYLLVTADVEDAARRVDELKKLGAVTIYAQPERNERLGIVPNHEQKNFAGRYIYSGIFRSETWEDYKKRNYITFKTR